MIVVPKVWGSEQIIANRVGRYCGKLLLLNEGWQCSLHHHRIKDETFYISKGRVWMEHGSVQFEMREGDSIHIEPFIKHRFGGLTDAVIFEVSTPHSDDDVYRHEESRRRGY